MIMFLRFRGNIQVNQMGSTNRAYGFVSTNDGKTIFGGNLRLDDNAWELHMMDIIKDMCREQVLVWRYLIPMVEMVIRF